MPPDTAASTVSTDGNDTVDTVVLDLDGTLVDSVPVHVLAWQAAFRDVGLVVASHRVHRSVGMGGDRLVAAVTDDTVEDEHGDELRSRQVDHLDRLFDAIRPTDGAGDLLAALAERGYDVVLASSSERALTDRLLGLVDGTETLRTTVSGDDADESKPSGALVEEALSRVDAPRAVMVGDTVWDVRSAQDAGVPCLGLLTGGVSEAELREAGAVDVVETPRVLAERLRRGEPIVTHPGGQP